MGSVLIDAFENENQLQNVENRIFLQMEALHLIEKGDGFKRAMQIPV